MKYALIMIVVDRDNELDPVVEIVATGPLAKMQQHVQDYKKTDWYFNSLQDFEAGGLNEKQANMAINNHYNFVWDTIHIP